MSRRPVVSTGMLITAALLTSAAISAATLSIEAPRQAAAASARHAARERVVQPNIVLITTDDENLSDMRWMPKTRRLIGAAGATMTNSISNHPNCCPARGEILTGQYAQNNGVRTNAGRFGGFRSLHDYHDTIAPWLSDAGYRTSFTGKFLNGFRASSREPVGWTQWHALLDGKGLYRYYDYAIDSNDQIRWYPKLYVADYLAAQGDQFIRNAAADGKPFFLWESHVAPHGALLHGHWKPPVPARRDQGVLTHVRPTSFSDPSFREADLSDKPQFMTGLPLFPDRLLNKYFTRRIQSLQAVDDAVATTIATLRETGQLANTYIIFTSDNGYLLGEHNFRGKVLAYEDALRVPLLIRGPGIASGVRRSQVVATLDLAPTIADIANAHATVPLDGRSLLSILTSDTGNGWSSLLVQAGPRTGTPLANTGTDPSGWLFRGLRTPRYTFVHYPLYRDELYDRHRDPAELKSVLHQPAYAQIRRMLEHRLSILADCKGATCRTDFPKLPPPGHQ